MPSAVAPARRAAASSPPAGGENLPFVVVRLARDGTLLHAGAGAEALTGYALEVLARPHFGLRLVHPEDRHRLTAALRHAGGTEAQVVPLRLVRADGRADAVTLHLGAWDGEAVEAVVFVGPAEATTEAKVPEPPYQALLRLRARYDEAETALRAAALTSPDGLAFLEKTAALLARTSGADRARTLLSGDGEAGDDGALVSVTLWTETLNDLPDPVEIAPTDWPALAAVRPVVLTSGGDPAARALLGACGASAALVLPFRDGLSGDGGAPALGAFLLEKLEDDRAWDRAETRALGRLAGLFETLWAWTGAEARYRQTVADLEDGLFSFAYDLDGRRRYAFVTPCFEALTGSDAERLTAAEGDAFADLVHDDDRAAFEAHESALRAGDPSRLVFRLRRADSGAVRWLCERATPGRSPSGRPVVGGLVSDVTEQKAAEDALVQAKLAAEQASEAKTAFLATMSHELRSPLGAIRGFAELLADEVREASEGVPPTLGEFAGIISENTARALRLVHDLFDLSRLETGALELARVPVALHPAVARVVAHHRAEAEAKGLDFLFTPADGDPTVLGDPARVEEVVAHLVSNAVKFTPEGAVTVSTVVDGEAVRLVVEDTGIGIAEGYLERLFEPFSQEDYRLNRAYGGSGLGLAITRRLLDGMGATIRVESEKGRGSRFEVAFEREGGDKGKEGA